MIVLVQILFLGFRAQLLDPKLYKDVDKIKLEYLGFCAWKIFKTNGALLPGNPHLGVGRTMNMNFAFSSVEAGRAFGVSPKKYALNFHTFLRSTLAKEFCSYAETYDK